MSTARIVPVNLGCCPDAPRCVICPPPPVVGGDLVAALVEHFEHQHGPDAPLHVRFFGGAPPSSALIEAAGDRPISVRVRPDLLTRADATRLSRQGVSAIELDVLTRNNEALRTAGRRYRASLVDEITDGLTQQGFEVGAVWAPGLPGTSHAIALADARWSASRLSFVRLHPVLVLDRSALRLLHEEGRYEPLTLGEAVTVCRDMLDILEPAGVAVHRIGLQPGPDGFGRAVAGPRHSSLRELVEARRVLDRLRHLLRDVSPGSDIIVRCAMADETRVRGHTNINVRTLRAELGLATLTIEPDPTLPRGTFRADTHQDAH